MAVRTPSSSVPKFAPTQQTVAARWQAVGHRLAAGVSDGAIASAGSLGRWRRYVAGELDLQQVEDELRRRYQPAEAPPASVRPLPPLVPGCRYPYAAELAALHAELRRPPPRRRTSPQSGPYSPGRQNASDESPP